MVIEVELSALVEVSWRDAGNLPELPFQRRRDRRRHRLRAGALKRGTHRDGRKVDLRQGRDRQERYRDQSDEADRGHQTATSQPDVG